VEGNAAARLNATSGDTVEVSERPVEEDEEIADDTLNGPKL
jgi:hypothetical protein